MSVTAIHKLSENADAPLPASDTTESKWEVIMATIIQVNFATIGPIGTPILQPLKIQGVDIVLPNPSSIQTDGPGIGIRIDKMISFKSVEPLQIISLYGYTGAKAPLIRLIDILGNTILNNPVVVDANHLISPQFGGLGPIRTVILEYPNGEGNVYNFAATHN